MDIQNLISGKAKVEEKKLIEFIKPVDPTIKSKLQGMASGGFSGQQPRLITMELIAEAIAEYKQEKQIFSLEITQTNCTELALSFKKLLLKFQKTSSNFQSRKPNKRSYLAFR